jgi:hypothetical protein
MVEKIFQKTTVLSCITNWDDAKILGVIARYGGLETLSLNRCEEFQSFSYIPSALKSSKLTTLRLSRCNRVSLHLLHV